MPSLRNEELPGEGDTESLEASPEELRGVAGRLQRALEELFAVREEARDLGKESPLPEEVERVLAAAAQPKSGAVSGAATETPRQSTDSCVSDRRVYLTGSAAAKWTLQVKSGEREYCHHRRPGEEWFHLLVDGEVYLQCGTEKMCLNCAFRGGVLTDDRLFWQTRRRGMTSPPTDAADPPSNAGGEGVLPSEGDRASQRFSSGVDGEWNPI